MYFALQNAKPTGEGSFGSAEGGKYVEQIVAVIPLFTAVGECEDGPVDLSEGGLVTGRGLVLVAARRAELVKPRAERRIVQETSVRAELYFDPAERCSQKR